MKMIDDCITTSNPRLPADKMATTKEITKDKKEETAIVTELLEITPEQKEKSFSEKKSERSDLIRLVRIRELDEIQSFLNDNLPKVSFSKDKSKEIATARTIITKMIEKIDIYKSLFRNETGQVSNEIHFGFLGIDVFIRAMPMISFLQNKKPDLLSQTMLNIFDRYTKILSVIPENLGSEEESILKKLLIMWREKIKLFALSSLEEIQSQYPSGISRSEIIRNIFLKKASPGFSFSSIKPYSGTSKDVYDMGCSFTGINYFSIMGEKLSPSYDDERYPLFNEDYTRYDDENYVHYSCLEKSFYFAIRGLETLSHTMKCSAGESEDISCEVDNLKNMFLELVKEAVNEKEKIDQLKQISPYPGIMDSFTSDPWSLHVTGDLVESLSSRLDILISKKALIKKPYIFVEQAYLSSQIEYHIQNIKLYLSGIKMYCQWSILDIGYQLGSPGAFHKQKLTDNLINLKDLKEIVENKSFWKLVTDEKKIESKTTGLNLSQLITLQGRAEGLSELTDDANNLKENISQRLESVRRMRSERAREEKIPSAFLCGISGKKMQDPVLCMNGISCERQLAEDTQQIIAVSNTVLAQLIKEYEKNKGFKVGESKDTSFKDLQSYMGSASKEGLGNVITSIISELFYPLPGKIGFIKNLAIEEYVKEYIQYCEALAKPSTQLEFLGRSESEVHPVAPEMKQESTAAPISRVYTPRPSSPVLFAQPSSMVSSADQPDASNFKAPLSRQSNS
jgi:hypothetical protein